MDLMYLLYSLLRKKWVIISCTVFGLLAGLIFTFSLEKTYLSLTQYSTGFTMAQKVSIKQDEQFNLYEIDIRFNNMMETFKSPTVIGTLSNKLLLHDLESPVPFRNLSDEQKRSLDTSISTERARQILRSKIARMELLNPYNADEKKVYDLMGMYGYDRRSLGDRLIFERVPNTDFVNIFFRSENPELSAYVVNTIGDQFVKFFSSIYGIRTKIATTKIDSLADAKKREVDSLTAKLKTFRDQIGTPNIGDKGKFASSVVEGLTASLQQELAKLNNLNGELNAVETQLKDMYSISTPSSVNNNSQILDLQRKNAQLEKDKAGKTDTEIKELDDQIQANLRKIAQLSSSNSPARTKDIEKAKDKRDDLISEKIKLQQQIAATESNITYLRREKATYEGIASTGGGDEVVLKAKENELEAANREYNQLKAALIGGADTDVNPEGNFKQTIVGQPAYEPEPSGKVLIIGLAGIVMLFLSCFVILLLEFLDASHKTPTIFQRNTKLKLLSSVNKINLHKKTLEEYFSKNGALQVNEAGKEFVENVRKLRYELEHSGKKIFLVTSTKPREGKTTIIEALANSLSLSRKKVLLVDANFSNNTLTEKFGAKPALENFSVNGQANLLEKLNAVSISTSIPNTEIVGCNEGNFTPAEILPKNSLLDNLKKISDNYDFIFIEGAALNTHADSKELAKYADGIVAVFSARSVLRQTDKDSIDYLNSTGDKFAGSVLNYIEDENIDL